VLSVRADSSTSCTNWRQFALPVDAGQMQSAFDVTMYNCVTVNVLIRQSVHDCNLCFLGFIQCLLHREGLLEEMLNVLARLMS